MKDAVKCGLFRYGIEAKNFYVLVYLVGTRDRYTKEIWASFNVRIGPQGEIEFKSAAFAGLNAKLWNYQWRFRSDPLKMPQPPLLIPGSPDVLSSSMFSGPGVIHKQYPRPYYPSSIALGRHYPHRSARLYGNPVTRREGLPSAMPKFSSQGKGRGNLKPRKLRQMQSNH